ncbi:F-box only protein 40 [Hoplias malabaricus]|uniref:F-box only protein 40 n=1 Tax=Hoplias malabaricus TaxID=27720 RepID=UPI003462D04B
MVTSSRYKRSVPKLHRHCESCYSKRCRAPIEVSVSCMVVNCRLLCGATFHMCKEDEHTLLCPNEKVPCFNAHYGCPFTMSRSKLAKHLEVCPASVVCCSMEWNRWPIEDVKSPLCQNLLKSDQEPQPLDLSMALRDQKHLCARLKMRSFFPELMDEPEEPLPTEEEVNVVEDVFNEERGAIKGIKQMNGTTGGEILNYGPLKAAAEEPVENAQDWTVNTEKYNLFEKMFNMKRGGCKQAGEESKELKANKEKKKDVSNCPTNPHIQAHQQEKFKVPAKEGAVIDAAEPEKTGFAPWQEGVLERLSKEVNPREFNMYVVHHGRMLLSFGQIEACTPKEKDFVYGSLEPIPVQTLRSFSVPVSYRHRRIQLKDPSTRPRTEHKSVDTVDLGVSEKDAPKMDEMFGTLLCAAEVEIRGHKISETVATDGLYVDIATQTYDFDKAPFKYNANLADITVERDLKLYLQTDTESVTLRYNKSTSAFNFLCGHFFRRDEFPSHYKNVHSDIQSCLCGWFEQRCPLAYLGCTFSQKHLQPSTHRATVSYNQDLSIFTLRPEIPVSLTDHSQVVTLQQMQAKHEDCLSNLPFEVLRHIASYLDSFSLSQLALVSRVFREVSATLLQERGMVGLKWRKKIYSHGRARWKSSVVWEFSSLFSRVGSWCVGGSPSMAEHLKQCPFYQTEPKKVPFPLPSMWEHTEVSEERESLVTLFKGRRKVY